jgi:hypothetical protein
VTEIQAAREAYEAAVVNERDARKRQKEALTAYFNQAEMPVHAKRAAQRLCDQRQAEYAEALRAAQRAEKAVQHAMTAGPILGAPARTPPHDIID